MAPPKSRWEEEDDEDDDEHDRNKQQQQQQPARAPAAAKRAAPHDDDDEAAAAAPARKRAAAAASPPQEDDDAQQEQQPPADNKPPPAAALLDRALQEAAEFRQRLMEQEQEAAAGAGPAAGAGAGASRRPRRVGLAALSEEEEEEAEARARVRAEAAARRQREQQEEEQEEARKRAAAAAAAAPAAAAAAAKRPQQQQPRADAVAPAAVGLDDLDDMGGTSAEEEEEEERQQQQQQQQQPAGDEAPLMGPALLPPAAAAAGAAAAAEGATLPEPSPSSSDEGVEGEGDAPVVGAAPLPADGAAGALPLPSPPSSSDDDDDGGGEDHHHQQQQQQQEQQQPQPHPNTFESSDDELPPAPETAAAATAAAAAAAATTTTGAAGARPPPPPPATIIAAASATRECRPVDAYEKLNRISEGTYGVVFRARDKRTGGIYALKRVKLDVGAGGNGGGGAAGGGAAQHGFPQTALREVGVLLALRHPNLVAVREVCVSSAAPTAAASSSVFVVMEYVEHDLRHLLDRQKAGELPPFSTAQVKCLFAQLLSGLSHLHSRWVLHRDLKTSNLLYGDGGALKICDMGLARPYASPLRAYTPTVATLWYRPIERLLGQEPYSTELDCWAAGCILAELLRGEPLFPGRGEIDQIRRIFDTLGTPREGNEWPGWESLPGCQALRFPPKPPGKLREMLPRASLAGGPTLSDAGYDLLTGLLALDPRARLSADEALAHAWFREPPLPTPLALMPAFPQQAQP